MNSPQLMTPPRLWPTDHKNRRVTWMELFFDLIFVAAVSEIGKSLSVDFSAFGLFRYALLFLLIWWAWCGHTLYSTRFDSDDAVQRAFLLLQCFIAAVMAANAREALDSRSSAGFGAAYAGMRLILVAQYLRARHIPSTQRLATRFAAGFGVAALIWITSAMTEPPVRYWLWAVALAADFVTPWIAERHGRSTPPHPEHFPERFGLFTIILLGEFVSEVMRGIAAHEEWSLEAAGTAIAGMAVGFTLWWWYFDCADSAGERHVRDRRQQMLFQIWNYSHLPLFVGIGAAGVGIKHLIALRAGEHMHKGEASILLIAMGVVMMALATIGLAAPRTTSRKLRGNVLFLQYAIALFVILSGAYAHELPKVLVALVLLMTCAMQALLTQMVRKPGLRIPIRPFLSSRAG